jgi:DNA-binding CsgD family transcriptional regulator
MQLLSAREQQVLVLLCRDKTNPEIAAELQISTETV